MNIEWHVGAPTHPKNNIGISCLSESYSGHCHHKISFNLSFDLCICHPTFFIHFLEKNISLATY